MIRKTKLTGLNKWYTYYPSHRSPSGVWLHPPWSICRPYHDKWSQGGHLHTVDRLSARDRGDLQRSVTLSASRYINELLRNTHLLQISISNPCWYLTQFRSRKKHSLALWMYLFTWLLGTENWCESVLSVVGHSTKKRPIRLPFARIFDGRVLDTCEVGMEEFVRMDKFEGCAVYLGIGHLTLTNLIARTSTEVDAQALRVL